MDRQMGGRMGHLQYPTVQIMNGSFLSIIFVVALSIFYVKNHNRIIIGLIVSFACLVIT